MRFCSPVHLCVGDAQLAALCTDAFLLRLMADAVFQHLVPEYDILLIPGLEVHKPVAAARRISDHDLGGPVGEIPMVAGEEQRCPVLRGTAGVPQFDLVYMDEVEQRVIRDAFLDQGALIDLVPLLLDGILAAAVDFPDLAQGQLVLQQHVHGHMKDFPQRQQLFGLGEGDVRLPFGNGLPAHMAEACKFLLGHPVCLSQRNDLIRQFHGGTSCILF